MGNYWLFKDCVSDKSIDEEEINKNRNELIDLILFNLKDYENLNSDRNIIDEDPYNLSYFPFVQNYGYEQIKQKIVLKDISFKAFDKILHSKLGIIVILSSNVKKSFFRVKILLDNLENKIYKDKKRKELIKKNCSIFLLNEQYNDFRFIMGYAGLDKNDLPSILFVKKVYEEQEFDEDCILFKTSDFEDVDFFFDSLMNIINPDFKDNRNIQVKNMAKNVNEFLNDDLSDQKHQKPKLLIPDNTNNDHNSFITNKIENSNKNNLLNDEIKKDSLVENNNYEIKNDSLVENNNYEIKNHSLVENNNNEIKNDSLVENNINEIKNDSLVENNIEDEKKYNTFKDDFDSMNLSYKNNNNIIDSQKSNKLIKSYITEKEIKEAKENLNIEPDEDNEDSTEIIIRYPNTGKRASRRFLKENKIQYLYNYILSLDDLLEEINYQQFKMSQPFPLKYFEDLDESFENYGLYPDGIIDIYVKE